MPFKPSNREQTLRHIATSVRQAMHLDLSISPPEDHEDIRAAYEPQRIFLEGEILSDRQQRYTNNQLDLYPPAVRRLW